MDVMAAWCFLCDAPVDGAACPTCGHAPTLVEDPMPDEPRPKWWSRIPRRTWLTGGAIVVVLLYTLFESGFRLVD
jgi:hypothetical protein